MVEQCARFHFEDQDKILQFATLLTFLESERETSSNVLRFRLRRRCIVCSGSVGNRSPVGGTHWLLGGFLSLTVVSEAGEREGQDERDHDEGPEQNVNDMKCK